MISSRDRRSQIASCIQAAHHFLLGEATAIALIQNQLEIIGAHWQHVCAQAALGASERAFFWGRQFLNPYAFQELTGNAAGLELLAEEIRGRLGD